MTKFFNFIFRIFKKKKIILIIKGLDNIDKMQKKKVSKYIKMILIARSI